MDVHRTSVGRVARAIAMLVVVAVPAIAAAAPARSFAVVLAPATPALGWRADALAAALSEDLVDDRLAYQPVAAACAAGCSDTTLRAAGVELIVRGTIDADELRYQLVPLWSGAPAPVRGRIGFAAIDRAGLAAALRDPMHRIVRARADDGGAVAVALPDVPAVAAVLACVAALLATPFLFGLYRRRGARRILAMRALRGTAIAVAGIGGAAIAIAAIGENGPWFAAGGVAWGTLVTVLAPLVCPPLVGLGRVEHDELGRSLRAWLGVAALRAIAIAALYAPIAVATWFACDALAVDPALRLALAMPGVALVVRHWVRSTIAVTALGLDDALVEDSPDTAAWHDAVRAYLVGYLRRSGLPVDDELYAHVRFLPGKAAEANADVAIYGGGLCDSRIVIPRRMLELALSPWGRPHDYAAPRISTLHWTQWNAGLVMATAPGAPIATREQRRPREVTAAEGTEVETDAEAIDPERMLLGEPPTLAGIIEPAALDPRTGYRPHDDPMWLDWDPGDDYDGTDAGDRDFLFGALVHGLGQIQRHAAGVMTLTLAASLGKRGARVARLRARAPTTLGDLHAALGGARHHLVQYLAWRLWRREDLLTARAYAPELEAASRRVLRALAEPPATGDPHLRRRLAALGALVRHVPAPRPRWRRFVLAGALVAGLGVAALAVADAVRYHAIYAERMRARSTERSSHGKE